MADAEEAAEGDRISYLREYRTAATTKAIAMDARKIVTAGTSGSPSVIALASTRTPAPMSLMRVR